MNTGNDTSALISAGRAAGALSVRTDPPFQWASGARMPMYNDNRRLIATPEGRGTVRRGLARLVTEYAINCDAIAGTASAGIAPATLLAEERNLPLYYVRSETKDHGRNRRIEGAPDRGITGCRVLLVEDLISTGGSSAAAAEALIDEGAIVVACVAIFSYGFQRATERFRQLPGSPPIYTLATVTDLVADAVSNGWLSAEEIAILRDWQADPFGWWDRRGGSTMKTDAAQAQAESTVSNSVSTRRAGTGSATPAPTERAGSTSLSAPSSLSVSSSTLADVARDRIQRRLDTTAAAAGHLVCVGLDPRPELLPAGRTVGDFLEEVIDTIAATGIPPAAFKPNIAFFHQLDRPHTSEFSGSQALSSAMKAIHRRFPGVPIILDAKRGDIATTSAAYATEAFEAWNADALTVSPFMGDDSVGPILDAAEAFEGRWIYILNRTSNAGARRFQNRLVTDGAPLAGNTTPTREPLFETIAATIQEWQRQYGTAGAVIGATAPDELRRLLEIHREAPLPILVPGVGAQGADAASVVKIVRDTAYPLELVRINASRQIVFPWAAEGVAPPRWQEAIREQYLRVSEEAAV